MAGEHAKVRSTIHRFGQALEDSFQLPRSPRKGDYPALDRRPSSCLRWFRQAGAAILVVGLSGGVSISAHDHAMNFYHTLAAVDQSERGGPKFAKNIEVAKFAVDVDSSDIIANHIDLVLRKDTIERNINVSEVRGVYCKTIWAERFKFESWYGWMRFNGYIRPISYIARWGLAKVFVIKDHSGNSADINFWGMLNGNPNISAQLPPRSADDREQSGGLEQCADSDGCTQKYRNVIIERLILAVAFIFGGFHLALNTPDNERQLLSAKFVGSCLLIAFGLCLLWLICIPATLEWYL